MDAAAFPTGRPRRLRRTSALRDLVAQTRLHPRRARAARCSSRRVCPSPPPITSMPGVVQHSRESLRKAAVEAAHAGVGGLMLFGVPSSKDAVGSGATDPDGILNVAIRDVVSEVGDATGRDERPLPRRVHRSRALRCARRRRLGRQRRNAAALRRHGSGPGVGGRPCPGPVRDDGRPGRRRPSRARRGGRHRHGAARLLREVRLRVLRAVPRGRRVLVAGRPARLPAGPAEPRRGAARARPRHRRGRRHRHGQAGTALSRRAAPPGRRGGGRRHPAGGLPGVRRDGDGRGGVRQGLARPRPHDPRDADLDPARRRGHRAHLLGGRGGTPADRTRRRPHELLRRRGSGVGCAARRAPSPSRRAASTRPCAPSAPWAARRGSWCPAAAPTSPTPTAGSTSTWSARGARCCSATPTRRSWRRSRPRSRRARRSARRPRARSRWPRRSSSRVEPVEQVRLVSSGTEATMSADPARPRLHRPQQGREVRGLLSRPRRRVARRGRLGRRDARVCPTPPA